MKKEVNETDMLYYLIYKYYKQLGKFAIISLGLLVLFVIGDMSLSEFGHGQFVFDLDVLIGLFIGMLIGVVIIYLLFLKVLYHTPMFDGLGHPTEELERIKAFKEE